MWSPLNSNVPEGRSVVWRKKINKWQFVYKRAAEIDFDLCKIISHLQGACYAKNSP